MRKVIFILMAVLMVISAPSFAQSKKEVKQNVKAEKRAKEKADILKCISAKKIKIEISHIYPTESNALQNAYPTINKNTSYGYYVQINDSLFTCYLPYIGTSRTAIMGGENLSLEAKDQKVDINTEYDSKTDSYLYQFSYKNNNMHDTWKCTIQLFTNGEANIRMEGNSRDAISYQGTLLIPQKEE